MSPVSLPISKVVTMTARIGQGFGGAWVRAVAGISSSVQKVPRIETRRRGARMAATPEQFWFRVSRLSHVVRVFLREDAAQTAEMIVLK